MQSEQIKLIEWKAFKWDKGAVVNNIFLSYSEEDDKSFALKKQIIDEKDAKCISDFLKMAKSWEWSGVGDIKIVLSQLDEDDIFRTFILSDIKNEEEIIEEILSKILECLDCLFDRKVCMDSFKNIWKFLNARVKIYFTCYLLIDCILMN